MFGLGTGEIVILALVVFLLFGAKKLPQLGSSMGQAIKNFKKGLNEKDSTTGEIDKENKEG